MNSWFVQLQYGTQFFGSYSSVRPADGNIFTNLLNFLLPSSTYFITFGLYIEMIEVRSKVDIVCTNRIMGDGITCFVGGGLGWDEQIIDFTKKRLMMKNYKMFNKTSTSNGNSNQYMEC